MIRNNDFTNARLNGCMPMQAVKYLFSSQADSQDPIHLIQYLTTLIKKQSHWVVDIADKYRILSFKYLIL